MEGGHTLLCAPTAGCRVTSHSASKVPRRVEWGPSCGVEQDIRPGPHVLPYGTGVGWHTAAVAKRRLEIHPGDAGLLVPALLSEPRKDNCGSSFVTEVLFQTDCPLFPQDSYSCQADIPPPEHSRAFSRALGTWGLCPCLQPVRNLGFHLQPRSP